MTEVILVPSAEISQVVSFLAGLFTGVAFVIAAAARWR